MPRPTRFFPGQLYGRLTAVERSERADYGRFVCACGASKEVLISHVTRGRVQSCGCLQKERASQNLAKRQTTHGQFGTKTYAAWRSMRARCENPNSRAYANYGGRGIAVSARWKKFENFLEDMGECPPGLTLERKDNSRGYSLDNCIWADWATQANNRRSCKQITYLGKTQTVTQWATELKLPRDLLYSRLAAGWSPEAAFTTPKTFKKTK